MKSKEWLGKSPLERSEAEKLLAHALNTRASQLYFFQDHTLTQKELTLLDKLAQQRAKQIPFEYLTGEVEFLDCRINVTPDVLIPRQETEILVDKIIHRIKPTGTLWDICCGSGCIAIALKKAYPSLNVIASDLSYQALAIAKKNAKKNGVEIAFLQGDLFEPFEGQKADVIVMNPPYIAEWEYEALQPEVKKEPKRALISGETGYEFYERITKALPTYINPKGKLFLEIGATQGEKLKTIFNGGKVEKDFSHHDRFFSLEL